MENELIASLRRRIAAEPASGERLRVGLGDDAAILRRFSGNLAVTTDLLSDGVDFIVGKTPPELIGRKALCVNLSDLAAMGAAPHSAVVSVLLPRSFGKSSKTGNVARFAERLYDGMAPVARQYAAAIAGGDTNSWDGGLAISITAFGTVDGKRAFLRSGAKPGDRILTTGRFGGSIFSRQFTFTPRVLESLYLNRHFKIHAAIDVSDGLLLDLSRLAAESNRGFRLDEQNVPIYPDAFRQKKTGRVKKSDRAAALRAALGDGEDFELILAVPPSEARRLLAEQPFLRFAEFLAGQAQKEGKAVFDRMKKIAESTSVALEPYPISEAAVLTDIGEFLPKSSGALRQTADGESVPIADLPGWKHLFD